MGGRRERDAMLRAWVVPASLLIALGAHPIATSAATSARVRIVASTYHPKLFNTKVGRSVTWKNLDGVNHSATSDLRGFFDTGILDTYMHATESMFAAGTFPYHCTIHPYMHGLVQVRVRLSATSTSVGDSVTVFAASKSAARAFRYDYAKRFDGRGWMTFRSKSSKRSMTYTANRAGTLRFRSRVYNGNGKPSGWSSPAALTVAS